MEKGYTNYNNLPYFTGDKNDCLGWVSSYPDIGGWNASSGNSKAKARGYKGRLIFNETHMTRSILNELDLNIIKTRKCPIEFSNGDALFNFIEGVNANIKEENSHLKLKNDTLNKKIITLENKKEEKKSICTIM